MKILVAIESCFKDRVKHQAQRDTWLKDFHDFFSYSVEKKFFLGDVVDKFEEDEVPLLSIKDTYETLSTKTQAICQWAAERDFDFLLKVDTDTVAHPRNLVFSNFQNHDYSGGFNEDQMPTSLRDRFGGSTIQFPSGGAGYWLSRKSLTIVANSDKVVSCAEDVFVAAVLKEHGILPSWNTGYRWRPGATVDKDAITLHLSSALQKKYEPAMMYKAYEEINNATYPESSLYEQLKREFL